MQRNPMPKLAATLGCLGSGVTLHRGRPISKRRDQTRDAATDTTVKQEAPESRLRG
jgi:hypothetical protein